MSENLSTQTAGAARVQQFALIGLGIILAVLGLYVLQGFVKAILWACIFAVAVRPLYARAERRWPPGPHNLLLPLVFTLGIALIFVGPLVIGGVQLAFEVKSLLAMAVEYQKTGIPVPGFVSKLPFASSVTAWWADNLSDQASIAELLGHVSREQMTSVSRDFGASVARRTISFVFTILTLFFLFKEGDAIAAQLRFAATRALGLRGERLAAQITASVHGTVDGLVLVGIGEGALIGVAYFIAGVPHPTIFAAVTAVAAMIPFGAQFIFGAAALVLLAQGSTVAAVAVFVFGFLVTFIADHTIRPVLIGGATKLPFLLVLFGILGGVETFGLIGLFVGPALLSVLILLWREWVTPAAGGLTKVST